MPPGFLGCEYENWRKEAAERIENRLHDGLRRAAARRISRVAIHPVLCDVDVEAAQIDSAKLIDRVINLVKFECCISGTTVSDHVVQPLKNPPINQSKVFIPGLLVSRSKVVKITQ